MKKKNCLFVTYTEYYTEYNQQWNVFSAFNPSECTHTGAAGSQRCGARGAVGGSVPCSRVSPQSWTILPRSIRATTAPLYMMPYTVLGVFIFDFMNASRAVNYLSWWYTCKQMTMLLKPCSFVCRQTVSCRKMRWKVLHDSNSVKGCLYCTS